MVDSPVQQPDPAATAGRGDDRAAAVVQAPHGGVALRRLLAVATLTPAQAGLLAVDLVDQLAVLRYAGRNAGRVSDRWVSVTPDARLTLAPPAPGGDARPAVPALREALQDKDEEVRAKAAEALAEIESAEE
jgi:HEAT repeat protein